MDRADWLVCQGCRQPLRVKAGAVKRPHFAHKHLQACSFGTESPEILMARAALYDWLIERFPRGVTLEKQLEPEAGLPRPVDCWVETPSGALAYWIIDVGIKLETREVIKAALTRPGISPTWVFLYWMLNEEKRVFHSLLLSPTERVFLQSTPLDEMLSASGDLGRSIHYLDAKNQILTTYRNLTLLHRPNWFQGLKKNTPFDSVEVDRSTGGFMHPGEEQRRHAFLKKRKRLAEKRKKFEIGEVEDNPPRLKKKEFSRRDSWGLKTDFELPEPKEPEALRCVQCGEITTDYWTTFFEGDQKVCRCRKCLE